MVFYANGTAPHEALYKFRGSSFAPEMFRRVVPAVLELEAEGVDVTVNQGYRWKGTLADYQVGFNDRSSNNADGSKTSDGSANQFYQAGQAALFIATGGRFGTPSAATVGTSAHGDWIVGALDCSVAASGMAARDRIFRKYGLIRNISSETWHYANIGNPTVTLPTIDEAIAMADGDPNPYEKDWFDMATKEDLKNAIAEYFNGDPGEEGIDRIGQAIREHFESVDGSRQFRELTKSVLAEYFNGDPGNEGIDRIAQGVLKNDQSDAGKAALKTAIS